MQTLIYIDTETTGLKPYKNALAQVSALIVIDGEIVDEINLHINPFSYNKEAVIDPIALKTTGKTEEDLRNGMDAGEALKLFIAFIEQYKTKDSKAIQLAGYNTPFDVKFLKEWFRKYKKRYNSYLSNKEIDILPLVRHMQLWGFMELPNAKLSSACKFYDIHLDAHDALNDIKATRELHVAITKELNIKRGV